MVRNRRYGIGADTIEELIEYELNLLEVLLVTMIECELLWLSIVALPP